VDCWFDWIWIGIINPNQQSAIRNIFFFDVIACVSLSYHRPSCPTKAVILPSPILSISKVRSYYSMCASETFLSKRYNTFVIIASLSAVKRFVTVKIGMQPYFDWHLLSDNVSFELGIDHRQPLPRSIRRLCVIQSSKSKTPQLYYLNLIKLHDTTVKTC
jgi:hypothetical protein